MDVPTGFEAYARALEEAARLGVGPRLMETAARAIGEAKAAVSAAADGRWIADSEWQAKEAYEKLLRLHYELLVQERADADETAKSAVFSPSGGRDAAEQGPGQPNGHDGGGQDRAGASPFLGQGGGGRVPGGRQGGRGRDAGRRVGGH